MMIDIMTELSNQFTAQKSVQSTLYNSSRDSPAPVTTPEPAPTPAAAPNPNEGESDRWTRINQSRE